MFRYKEDLSVWYDEDNTLCCYLGNVLLKSEEECDRAFLSGDTSAIILGKVKPKLKVRAMINDFV